MWCVVIEQARKEAAEVLDPPIVIGPFASAQRALRFYHEACAKRERSREHGVDYLIRVADMRSPRTYTWLPFGFDPRPPAQILNFPGQARREDPVTSQDAARLVTARATSARIRILEAHYKLDHDRGLTDEEAAQAAGLDLASEYATRCSELRALGVLEDLPIRRLSKSGNMRQARRITDTGREIIEARNG